MIKVDFDSQFEKAFEKKILNRIQLEKKFWKEFKLFQIDPFNPTLKTHKLSGKLKDGWSFSVDYDCRDVFYFASASQVVFVDIGSHDDVY